MEYKPENESLSERLKGMFAGRPALPILGGLAAVVIAGIILVVVALGGGGGGSNDEGNHAGLAADEGATPVATIDLARATAAPAINPNLTSLAPGDKLIIDKIGVSAPLSYKIYEASGEPPLPDGPDDVAYYDFSQWPGIGGGPGKGGNSVLVGHVDWGSQHGLGCKGGTVKPPCQAVLWDLKKMITGDTISVQISGVLYNYKVTANDVVDATKADWQKIYATTQQETLTLITCGGEFSSGEYNKRIIVTAARV